MKDELQERINQMPVFDGHEHLFYPKDRYGQKTGFFELLHYIQSDLFSSGMKLDVIYSDAPFDVKLKEFLAYYEYIKTTGYGRMVRTFAKELYGVNKINEGTIKVLDEMIKSKSETLEKAEEWYSYVLHERCGIKTALTVFDDVIEPHRIIKPIVYLDFLMRRSQINYFIKLQNDRGLSSSGFEAYLEYIDEFLDRRFSEGILAGKFGTPYWRSLEFEIFTREKAVEEYNSDSEVNPNFEAFIYHYLLKRFEDKGLPIQFHTGHIEPSAIESGYDIHWSDPSPFAKLAPMYPDLKFILLHTGFPYQHEYLSLVKNHPNIHADFSWIYIVSPSAAKQMLNLAIEMLPRNKVIGFGGDCQHVEMVFAHLWEAKRVIAEVFSSKLAEGYMDEETAIEWIESLLYKNAERIYLKG